MTEPDIEDARIAEYVATIETLAHVVIELSKGKELSRLPDYVREAVVWAWGHTEHWPDADVHDGSDLDPDEPYGVDDDEPIQTADTEGLIADA